MQPILKSLLSYLDQSPTAAHTGNVSVDFLRAKGFEELKTGEPWKLLPGGAYFTLYSRSTLAAFVMGCKPPSETGFRITGAHTDAPGLQLKSEPYSHREGLATLDIEVYGGPILNTWFDRDLGLAGRAVAENGRVVLYHIQEPFLRIVSPAIHLNREVNKKGFKANPESEMHPIFATADDFSSLRKAVAESAGLKAEDMSFFSAELVSLEKAVLAGIDREFLVSSRIDDIASCHAALNAIAGVKKPGSTAVAVLFDNEEVGSRTTSGAGGPFLETLLERLSGGREEYFRAVSRSIMVSADCAHAVHPDWVGRHSPQSKPKLNGGPAVKRSAMQNYATGLETGAYFIRCAEKAGVAVQEFTGRADTQSGSTIGPITAARTGIPTVDVGNPMLAMHSIRETSGALDHQKMLDCMKIHMSGVVPAHNG